MRVDTLSRYFYHETFLYWIRINNSLGYRCLANDFFHEAITISQR